MRFAWLFNLDADFELLGPHYTTTKRLAEQLKHYGASARVLMGPDDIEIVSSERVSAAERFVGRSFCPTPVAVAKLRRAGVTPEPHPSVAILRQVNHRLFAHEIGGGLSDQHFVSSRAQIDALLARRSGWMLKRPLAFAGRGQLRIGDTIDAKQSAWIAASLKAASHRSDGLIVEPLVVPTLELSLHGFIWRDGRCELGRVCVQDVSAKGAFFNVRLAREDELDEEERAMLFRTANSVARSLFEVGYFGPFGIDGYRHEEGFCALSEINARFTMAFAVGFGRALGALVL